MQLGEGAGGLAMRGDPMASKGREGKRSRPVPTSKIKPPSSKGTGGGGASAEPVLPESWAFEIERPTPVASQCHAGDVAQGSRSGNSVAVSTDRGIIGFAPAADSASMIAALRRAPGAGLVGKVDAAGDRGQRRGPKISLVLVRGG
jgi:hypothetical protein